jgi:chemotaxis methyl-accepting protein methylase
MTEKAQPANVALMGPELSQIRALIEERSAIHFDQTHHDHIRDQVRKYMTARKLADVADFLRLLHDSGLDYEEFLECLLRQESWFLRRPSAFAVLEKKVLREIHQKKFWETPRSLRIWSAGCASGEEPYSIAMTICDSLEFAGAWNIHILATDISRNALEQAERGLFLPHALQALNPRQKETHFTRVNDQYLVRPQIRNMVSFAQMNLAQRIYMGRFDVIFCMDVLTYLNEMQRLALLRRFYEYLESGGYLFVGRQEPIARLAGRFEASMHDDCILYQKPIAPPKPNKVPHGVAGRNGKAEREKKA